LAFDAVVQVGDTGLPVEDAGALQLDLLGGEALEQPAPLAEEHRDHMELELVEDAGGECELSGSGPVDEHVLFSGGLLGPSHRGRDVVHVGDQRHLRELGGRLVPAEDEDRHAVVVVAAPPTGRLEGPAPGDGRPGGHEFVHDLAVDTARPADGIDVDIAAGRQPVVQPEPTVAEAVARPRVWPGDEPIERHGHVENGCGHDASFPAVVSVPDGRSLNPRSSRLGSRSRAVRRAGARGNDPEHETQSA
jgi:hypothetical protein